DDYVAIEPGPNGELVSEQLGITFLLEDGQLALFNTATGERLLTAEERAAQAQARAAEAEARAAQAGARAAEAEARASRETAARLALEDELARLRAAQGRKRKGK